MKLVFWLEELNLHFSAVIRAMTNMGHEISVFAKQELKAHRRALGWIIPDFGDVQVLSIQDQKDIQSIVRSKKEFIHILVGMRWPFVTSIIKGCIKYGCHFGFYCEAPHPDGKREFAKRVLYSYNSLTIGRKADFLLTLGQMGVKWYRSCWYPSNKLFQCAYATEKPECPHDEQPSLQDNTIEDYLIIFLGRCVSIKRIDILIKALTTHKDSRWYLRIVGDGPLKTDLEDLAMRLDLHDRVHFLGSLPYKNAVALLGTSDLLVLPSSHEGWGAVANEALMSGTPVICSDQSGAADLIRDSWRGAVFKSENLESLSSCLGRQIGNGKVSRAHRQRIKNWSECIEGKTIARYIVSVLEHVYHSGPRPEPPWLNP